MASRLQGKVAIVTGAGSGYGLGIATKLISEGANVIIADISEPNGMVAANKLGATYVKTDVTDKAQWQNLLEKTLSTYGALDIVVNNAGVCYNKQPSETLSDREFDLTMNVNVKSIFNSVAVIMPHFLQQSDGVFVNVVSTSAIRPRPGLAWYAASKAAVNVASNAMAIEYGSRGDQIQHCPVVGLTFITMQQSDLDAFASVIPLGRICTPEDVAGAVAYLVSPDAKFITGVNLQSRWMGEDAFETITMGG
ncbi:uncharacterized protein N7483_005176 [Penicillium malachiteum]|uniref:uncharacterized protein n=1 Tax=Penicillium malachiteum TaxID=1324776 RepID=UPI002548DDC9|nr:uncharacterized protein N7483_005176 [Penicillium malachiteum]KAJ5730668.1 hypothetical protein N7483_005176 [Penicillium malachiteum]